MSPSQTGGSLKALEFSPQMETLHPTPFLWLFLAPRHSSQDTVCHALMNENC